MNFSTAVLLMNENIRAVKCIYQPDPVDTSKQKSVRTLFKTLDGNIKIGDFVAVPSTTRHNITTVKVVEFVDTNDIDFDSCVNVDWIVGKINMNDYDAIKAVEEEAIKKIKAAEKTRKIKELRGKLLEHDEEMLKALPIASMKDLPSHLPSPEKVEAEV